MENKKRIIVLGFPRSGTASVAKHFGVGHEKFNSKGISDWHLVPTYNRRSNDEVYFVIRDPIDVIGSNLFTMRTDSLDFLRNACNIEDKRIVTVLVEAFIRFVDMIEAHNPKVIKVESLDEHENARDHPELRWDVLERITDVSELKEVAKKYGYLD
jgi:hypothetical protein